MHHENIIWCKTISDYIFLIYAVLCCHFNVNACAEIISFFKLICYSTASCMRSLTADT
jgi:hypothetical protein